MNVVLIGDHGMSTVDPGEPIRLREYLDPDDVEQALGQGAFVSIYAKPGRVEYVSIRKQKTRNDILFVFLLDSKVKPPNRERSGCSARLNSTL